MFPSYLREKVQDLLVLCWTFRVPVLQRASPAHLVADLLYKTLGDKVTQYYYVDFCAGGGGPTPTIEQALNKRILKSSHKSNTNAQPNSVTNHSVAQFILTDLHPNIPTWTKAAKRSSNISFVSESVDATNAPVDLYGNNEKKIFRLYNLSFHHFDDRLGSSLLRDTLEKSNGFGYVNSHDKLFFQ